MAQTTNTLTFTVTPRHDGWAMFSSSSLGWLRVSGFPNLECNQSDMFLVSHLVQCIRSRLWWLLWTIVLASAAEVFGWGGRLWSSYGPTNFTAYLMQ